MPGAYTYVDGANLVGLILEVHDEFLARLAYDPDDARRPNSLRLVAIDVFEGKPLDDQLLVIRDLMAADASLSIMRDEKDDAFTYSHTAGDYMTDLVCQVVYQVLSRNPRIRSEDERRMELAIEFAEALDN
jgi:hypothetical protein